jgi:drug/metabolite transporter (DMT)-like permease
VLGVLVLNETFSLPMGIGFALVILGSALATRPPGTTREPVRGPVEPTLGTAPK